MNEKSLVKADFYTSIILIAFGITAITLARQMPPIPRDPYSAPGVLPTLLGIIIASLGFVLLIRSIIRTRGKVGVSGSSFKAFLKDPSTSRMLITILLCISYVVLLGKLFFPLLTFLYIFVFIVIFEYDRNTPLKAQKKKLLIAVIVGICSAIAITAVFEYLFLLRLP